MTSVRSRAPLYGLLAAELISVSGTRMSVIAVPWFVLQTTGSAVQTGVVTFVELGALVTARILGGPIVDRLGARRASVTCDAIAAVTLGLVPLLHVLDLLTFPVLLVLVGVTGLLRGPGDSAKYVTIPDLAERSGMSNERVAGLVDGVFRLGTFIGAPLGALLVAQFGAPLVIAIDAGSFAVAAVLVAMLVRLAARPVEDFGGSRVQKYIRELREGFLFVRLDPFLLAVATMVFLTNMLDQALIGVLMPVWADERYGSPAVLGAIGAAFGAGAFIGTLIFTAIGERLPRRRTYAWAFLLGAVPRIFVLALPLPLWVIVAVNFVGSILVGAINPLLSAAEFERIPEHLRARVIGAVGGLAWAGMPIGGLIGGWLAEWLGVTAAITVVGIAYLIVTLDPFVRRAWHLMDRQPEALATAGRIRAQFGGPIGVGGRSWSAW